MRFRREKVERIAHRTCFWRSIAERVDGNTRLRKRHCHLTQRMCVPRFASAKLNAASRFRWIFRRLSVRDRNGPDFYIIVERDVGLFSLVQQAITNIARALQERRIPIVYFNGRTAYWTANGYRDRYMVWEY